ncbi:MAG: AAA-like domain-containing protein [Gammaproteobacteria bacterium]
MAKVFISYKRDVAPDQPFARALFERLSVHHQPFIDQEILVGEAWAARIKREIESADYLVLLISKHSIESGMVGEEIRIAEAARKQNDHPKLLPVRLACNEQLPYDIGAILNPLQYANWSEGQDFDEVIQIIELALRGHDDHLANPDQEEPRAPLSEAIPLSAANPRAPLEAPEGTMSADSPYYLERAGDKTAKDEQGHARGYTITIKGPRQIGKSSLLGQLMANANRLSKPIAFLDFQSFGQLDAITADDLHKQFAFLIEEALGLDMQVDKYWNVPLTPTSKCTRFMEKRVLKTIGKGGFLLALDEADHLLGSPICSGFFGMLRAWVNSTSQNSDWHGFCLAMVISSEPAMLIDDLSQSPFNVGAVVELEDFSRGEFGKMNESHGKPVTELQANQLYELLSGHPYLSRRALYGLCQGRYTFEAMITEAESESGPFGDHLRALLTRISMRPNLLVQLKTVLQSGRCNDRERDGLISGGLIVDRAGRLQARNQLYDRYFRKVLLG